MEPWNPGRNHGTQEEVLDSTSTLCAILPPYVENLCRGAWEGGSADALPRSRVPPKIYTVGGTKCPRTVPWPGGRTPVDNNFAPWSILPGGLRPVSY